MQPKLFLSFRPLPSFIHRSSFFPSPSFLFLPPLLVSLFFSPFLADKSTRLFFALLLISDAFFSSMCKGKKKSERRSEGMKEGGQSNQLGVTELGSLDD